MLFYSLRHYKLAYTIAGIAVAHTLILKSLSPLWMLYLPLFIGSIPFGYLFTKFAGHGDVRTFGSGNIGATNVLRTGNKKIALLTLLCDFFKGYAYVVFASTHLTDPWDMICVGLSLIIGHILGLWLGGKGGKGVATALGTFFAFSWPLGLYTLTLWLICAKLFKISSLSALLAALLSTLTLWGMWSMQITTVDLFYLAVYVTITTIIILYTHQENIRRLRLGVENKIGDSL